MSSETQALCDLPGTGSFGNSGHLVLCALGLCFLAMFMLTQMYL